MTENTTPAPSATTAVLRQTGPLAWVVGDDDRLSRDEESLYGFGREYDRDRDYDEWSERGY